MNENEYVDINAHDNYPDSDQKIEIPTMKVIPLKKICMTIGEIPTSYLETMTYYEMLVWFIEYLKNNIIPTVNNNAEAIQEVQSVVLALQNYINDYKDSIDQDVEDLEEYMNNYFENLDVQNEINNKLDEMLENGDLEQIIEQFLQLTSLICFDNVASMKESPNLINGSYAKTLGYYNKNDGGSALYKIRTITNSDVIDNSFIIPLDDNNLIAELIYGNFINVLQLGVKNDNTDTFSLIDNLFEKIENGNISVYFPSGQYYISETLYLPENTSLFGDGSSTVLTWHGSEDDYFINIKSGKVKCSIFNFTLDGNNLAYGIYDCDRTGTSTVYEVRSKIYNLWIENVKLGLHLDGTGSEIHNILIRGSQLYDDTNSIGLLIDGTDNFINDIRISLFNIGCSVSGSNNRLTTIKAFSNSDGFLIAGNYGKYNIDSQENKKDNIIIQNCTGSIFNIFSQMAGYDFSYLTGSDLIYSLVKIINSKSLVLSGSINARYRIANHYGNEKYGIYVDNDSSNINGVFSYYCFTNATILKLDFPVFYVKDNNTNNIVINYQKIPSSSYSNANITETTTPASCTSLTYSNNILTSTVKDETNINNKNLYAKFLINNINDPCFILLESEKMKFTNDPDAFILELRNNTLGVNLNYEVNAYTFINEQGHSLLRSNFPGLTQLLNDHQDDINERLDGQVDRIRLCCNGFVNERNNIEISCKILNY